MTVRMRFDPSKESIGAARRFVTRIVSDAPVEVRELVAVMVSELATNALLHAASGFDIVVDRSESTVTVAVTDWGVGSPELQSPGFTEPHGRGLRVVEALSDAWGTFSASEEAKAIWFRLHLQSLKTEEHATERLPVLADQTGEKTDPLTRLPSPTRGAVPRDERPTLSGATDPVLGRCLRKRWRNHPSCLFGRGSSRVHGAGAHAALRTRRERGERDTVPSAPGWKSLGPQAETFLSNEQLVSRAKPTTSPQNFHGPPRRYLKCERETQEHGENNRRFS